MTLKIPSSWTPSASQWDEAWKNCPYSTYFHAREWADIWESYTDGYSRPSPLAFNLADGSQIILPFSKNGTGFSSSFISSPAGTYGGWIAARTLTETEQQITISVIRKHYPSLLWRMNPYENLLPALKFGNIKNDFTYSLDVSNGFNSILESWIENRASLVRKAKSAVSSGVSIVLADSLQDWHEYYAIYEDSLRRWGEKASSKYDWRLFEILHGRKSENIKLWLAKYEGRPIAGALCFYSAKHAVYWHGAALADSFQLRPVNLLMHEAIQHAAESGRRWFDFNPSGGHAGVTKFKQSFGTARLQTDILSTEPLLQALAKGMHRPLAWMLRR